MVRLVDKPGGDVLAYLAGTNEAAKVEEAGKLLTSLNLNEQLYFSHVVRG